MPRYFITKPQNKTILAFEQAGENNTYQACRTQFKLYLETNGHDRRWDGMFSRYSHDTFPRQKLKTANI